MMRLSYLKTHWTPEEAHAILTFLDDLRDTLRHTYGSDIIEYYQQQQTQEQQASLTFEDDTIPF